MQWAFDIGAKQALKDGVSPMMSRIAREQAELAVAFGDGLPVAKLQRVALRFLGTGYALRRIRSVNDRDTKGGPIETFDVSIAEDHAASGAISTAASSALHRGKSAGNWFSEEAGDRAPAPHGLFAATTGGGRVEMAGQPNLRHAIKASVTAPRTMDETPVFGPSKPSARLAVQTHSLGRVAHAARDRSAGMPGDVFARDRGVMPTTCQVAGLGKNIVLNYGFRSAPRTDTKILAHALSRDPVDAGADNGQEVPSNMSATFPVAPRMSRASTAGAGATADVGVGAAVRPRHTQLEPESVSNADSRAAFEGLAGGQSRDSGETMGGDVYLDGALVGRWVSRLLTRDAERAPAGRTGFDIRRGRLLPGPTVGGQ